MQKKQVKKGKYLHILKLGIEITLVIILCLLVHRFLLFPNIFQNFSTHTPTGGSTFQNILVYFENLLDLKQGQVYQDDLNQFTWYSSIMGANEFSYIPSLIFGLFYFFSSNINTAFNSLVLVNLIILQLGIYFLINYYAKNKLISVSLAQLIPTTYGFKILHAHHLHAYLYFGLPFVILSLEHILKKNLSETHIWRWYIMFALSLASILFSTWHIIIFSGLLLCGWGVFQIPTVIKNFQHIWLRLLVLITITGVQISLLYPIAVMSLRASVVLASVRDINSVIAGGFKTLDYGYARVLLIPLSKLYIRFNNVSPDRFVQEVARMPLHYFQYPDVLSNIGFTAAIVAVLYIMLKSLVNRKLKHTTFLTYSFLFVSIYVIALGPFFRTSEEVYYQLPLPYLGVYKIYYPLNAIRTIWRLPLVGFFSFLVAFGIALNYVHLKLLHISSNYSIVLSKVVSILGVGFLIYLPVFTNANWQDPISKTPSYDSRLASTLDNVNKDTLAVFEWFTDDDFYINQREFSAFISKYNFDRGEDRLRWVLGGGLGTYAQEMYTLAGMQKNPDHFSQFIDILYSKDVDIIITTDLNIIKEDAFAALSERYINLDTYNSRSVWQKKDDLTPREFQKELEYSLEGSSKVEQGSRFNVYFNQQNESSKTYLTREVIKPENIDIVLMKDSEEIVTFSSQISKPLLLIPDTGRSTELPLQIPEYVLPGAYTFEINSNNTTLARKNIEVMSSDDFNNLLEEKELKYGVDKRTTRVRREIWESLPVKVNLEIKQGWTNLQRTKLSTEPIEQLKVSFSTEDDREYTGFPEWFKQPACDIDIQLVEGDNISVWCSQYVPYDYDFYWYKPIIETF